MAEHQHRVIIGQVFAHVVFVDLLPVGDVQHQVGALGVQNVHGEVLAPAVQIHGLPVLLGGIAAALIGGVALHHGAVDVLDHGLHKFRAQIVLVAHLARVELDGHLSGQLNAQLFVHPHDGLGGEFSCEVDDRLCHGILP